MKNRTRPTRNTAAITPDAEGSRRQHNRMILDCITDLSNHEKGISRQRVHQLTGIPLSIIDDHMKRMKDEKGILRLLLNGTYELVQKFPPPRPISRTVLAGGMCKLEIGDTCEEISPSEGAIIGELFYAAAVRIQQLHGEREVYDDVQRLKREAANLKQINVQLLKLVARLTSNRLQNELFEAK